MPVHSSLSQIARMERGGGGAGGAEEKGKESIKRNFAALSAASAHEPGRAAPPDGGLRSPFTPRPGCRPPPGGSRPRRGTHQSRRTHYPAPRCKGRGGAVCRRPPPPVRRPEGGTDPSASPAGREGTGRLPLGPAPAFLK